MVVLKLSLKPSMKHYELLHIHFNLMMRGIH